MHRRFPVLLAAAVALITSASAHAKINVVATTANLAALAADVGGADVNVEALSAPTEDPHYVDPKPSLIVKLNQADLLVVNGLELEVGWLPKLQVQARNPKIAPGGANVLDASTAVQLLETPGKIDRAQGDIHPGGNPHFLFDPRRGRAVAIALGERFAALDPAIATNVRARAAAVAAQLDAIGKDARAKVDALPAEKRRVVAYHRSLTYLVDWLGLEQVATIEPKPGIPPDPGHVAKVLSTMKTTHARALLQEEFYPQSTAKTLAQLTGARVVVLAGGARAGDSYAAYVTKLVTEVLRALAA